MKHATKALLIAKIKEREKIKPHTLGSKKPGPWDRRPHKADGGDITWDSAPDSNSSASQDNSSDIKWDAPPKSDAEPADHGLSERQKLSPLGKALSPITSYPETYSRMNKESRDLMSEGVDQLTHPGRTGGPDKGFLEGSHLWDIGAGAVKAATGATNYALSPALAAVRSIASQPIEDVTGIPREYPEFAAQLATPGLGMTKLGEAAPALDAATTAAKAAPSDVVSSAERISQVAPSPIQVPRAFASDNIAIQRAGQLARNVPLVGDSIPQATGKMVDQLGDAVKSIAGNYGEGSGPNIANRIGRNVGSAAEAETSAATDAARQSDDALLSAWNSSVDATHASINAREGSALEQARQSVGDMSPQDMGAALINRLRAGEQSARELKDRLYANAGEGDAAVRADSVQGVHNRVSEALDDAGRAIDPQLTPAANRMMDELRNFSQLRIPNRVGATAPNPGDVTAVDARGMEQVRKRLGAFSQAATNDADRAASRIIMRNFDDWQADAYDNALFSGSSEALQSFRDARAANASWRQRFYNDRDDADKLINKVVTGEVTPQEFSNWLVGASQVGSKGVSSRLLTRVAEATGNDPESLQAIRGGVWNRLSQSTEGATPKTPERIASGIHEFLNGSGRDVANRLFTPEQRDIVRAYSDTLRRGQQAREAATDIARNTKPSAMSVDPGPMQQLANSLLGKGGKTDEALFSAIDSYAKSGSRGDIKTLADIVRAVPEKDKGDLAGAIIRKLGQSKTTGEFSPDVFASEWNKYTPQAKAVLFGNAGAHRQALDDIAMISQRYKDVGRRFGNPSGTGQQVAGLGLVSSLIAAPLTTMAGLVGGTVAARVLSAPASAQKAANWSKTYAALSKGVTPERVDAFRTTSKSLAAAARTLGSNATPNDFMRLLPGSIPAGANDKQKKP